MPNKQLYMQTNYLHFLPMIIKFDNLKNNKTLYEAKLDVKGKFATTYPMQQIHLQWSQ